MQVEKVSRFTGGSKAGRVLCSTGTRFYANFFGPFYTMYVWRFYACMFKNVCRFYANIFFSLKKEFCFRIPLQKQTFQILTNTVADVLLFDSNRRLQTETNIF